MNTRPRGTLRTWLAAIGLTGAAAAQNSWACPDDGATIVVTNSGSGNESYTFKMNAHRQYDHELEIRVVTLDAQGEVVTVHETIPWTWGTDPTIVVGAGKSIQVRDPQDEDTKSGAGTYRKN
ncbi:MAG: hypothetical protein KF830_09700 [Planctomycetes bacterium]|nr:hypothetical protein [Planctomycetota bacterium]